MTITETLVFETTTCCVCGISFAVPSTRIKHCREHPGETLFCPNGHSLVWYKNVLEQEIEKLKRERDDAERSRMNLHQRLTEKEYEIKKLATNNKRLTTNIKKQTRRIAAGVCPCCNRTVSQLAEHIKTKHPEYSEHKTPNPIHTKINSK